MRFAVVLAFLLMLTGSAEELPPEAELVTDRPGFNTPPQLLSPGTLQFEGGSSFDSEKTQGTFSRTVLDGTPLIRFGISSRMELQFGGDGVRWYSRRTSHGIDRVYGVSDFSLGAKVKLRDESRFGPALAIVPSLSLPVGHSAFTSSGYDPSIRIALSKNLPRHFSVGGNINLSSVTDGAGRSFQRAFGLSVGHVLFAGLSGFWEVYSISPIERGGGATWVFSTGATHALGKNAQIDVEAGRTVAPLSPCWFVASGFVVRSPVRFLLHR